VYVFGCIWIFWLEALIGNLLEFGFLDISVLKMQFWLCGFLLNVKMYYKEKQADYQKINIEIFFLFK